MGLLPTGGRDLLPALGSPLSTAQEPSQPRGPILQTLTAPSGRGFQWGYWDEKGLRRGVSSGPWPGQSELQQSARTPRAAWPCSCNTSREVAVPCQEELRQHTAVRAREVLTGGSLPGPFLRTAAPAPSRRCCTFCRGSRTPRCCLCRSAAARDMRRKSWLFSDAQPPLCGQRAERQQRLMPFLKGSQSTSHKGTRPLGEAPSQTGGTVAQIGSVTCSESTQGDEGEAGREPRRPDTLCCHRPPPRRTLCISIPQAWRKQANPACVCVTQDPPLGTPRGP